MFRTWQISPGRALLLAALLTATPIAIGEASAQGTREHAGRGRYVVAESHWGNGTISGAVRRNPHGWQVRLPRGTWIDCVRSCSETLRRATVDFWQAQGGREAKDSGPGYFRWEFYY